MQKNFFRALRARPQTPEAAPQFQICGYAPGFMQLYGWFQVNQESILGYQSQADFVTSSINTRSVKNLPAEQPSIDFFFHNCKVALPHISGFPLG